MSEQRRVRRERDAEVARAAILQAAEDAFARAGFSGARVDEIATAAGYNKALIFHYFEDKLGLYTAAVSCMMAANMGSLRQIVERFADDEAPPTEKQTRAFIVEAVGLAFDFYLSHPKMLRILAWEIAEGWEASSLRMLKKEKHAWLLKARDFLRRAQEAGHIRPGIDPALLITNALGLTLMHLLSIPRYEHLLPGVEFSSPEAHARARAQIVELALYGAMPPPAQTTGDQPDADHLQSASPDAARADAASLSVIPLHDQSLPQAPSPATTE